MNHLEKLENQIRGMLVLQDKLNRVVDENWIELNRAWNRAIWTECAELAEHIGWKWWKKQTPDAMQIKFELVDIWHFGLSIIFQKTGVNEASFIASSIDGAMDLARTQPPTNYDFLKELEKFTSNSINYPNTFDHWGFVKLMYQAEMTTDELYVMYIIKNVLNKFRQDNGYKEGTYKKLWNGVEDNVYAAQYVETFDPSKSFEELSSEIYSFFEDCYQTI